MQTETQEQLTNANANLYKLLIGLSPKPNAPVGQVVLNLDSSLRQEIIQILIDNHSLVVDAESADEAKQKKMIEQNNELIARLLKLPFSVTTGTPGFPGSTDGFILNGKSAAVTAF